MRNLNNVLEDNVLQKIAPSVFATGAQSNISDRYSFLPTSEIVKGLRAEGWQPVWASEQKVRTAERRGFQKHMLRFRRIEDIQRFEQGLVQVKDSFPEIVLINSHDRSSAYQLHAGLFRLVCGNGMVVSDATFEKISIKHVNFNPSDVIEASYKILKAVPEIINKVEEFKAVSLTKEESLAFAESALILKYDTLEAAPVRAEKLLSVRRYEDKEESNLWGTLNVVQENIVRGGLKDRMRVNAQGRHFTRTREIKSLDENVKVNKALWHLAEKLKEMRAA